MRRTKTLLAALVVAVLALVFAACSDSSSDDAPNSLPAPDAAAFPVTINSTVGTAVIKEQPKRVVAIGWGSQDAALALGVVPVGMQDMTGDTSDKTAILPWNRDLLGDAQPTLLKYTTGEVPFEQIAALQPDVILAVNSGLTKEEFGRLNDIAPTVGYPGEAWLTSWQDQITIVGRALGLSAKAEELKAQTEKRITDAKAQHPEFAGKTAAFGAGVKTDGFNVYVAQDSRVQLLQALGFTIAPSVPQKADSFSEKVNMENITSIDADVFVVWYLSRATKATFESAPLFAKLHSVQRHGYVSITDPPFVYATSAVTVLSLPWMFDRYLPLLSTAANGTATT